MSNFDDFEMNPLSDEDAEAAWFEETRNLTDEGVEVLRDENDVSDHFVPKGFKVVQRPPTFTLDPWSPMHGDLDTEHHGDRCAVVKNARGEIFGGLYHYRSNGAFNKSMSRHDRDPLDPRWRCVTWTHEVHAIAFDGLVASFGDALRFAGAPLVTLGDDNKAWLLWRCTNGGGVVFASSCYGGPCGTCFGCRSLREADDVPSVSWVYFVQAEGGGPVKIGRSATPTTRLAALQTAHPHPLRIVAKIRGGDQVERSMHALFNHARTRPNGEWFNPTPDLVAFIKEVGGA